VKGKEEPFLFLLRINNNLLLFIKDNKIPYESWIFSHPRSDGVPRGGAQWKDLPGEVCAEPYYLYNKVLYLLLFSYFKISKNFVLILLQNFIFVIFNSR
jgi:hypothetical protein